MKEEIMLLILGTVIGGIIGFVSSFFMWKVQIKYDKRNIAQGFYLEISSLEKTIELYAKAFATHGPGANLVQIDQPFYGDGLFFTCRKEILVRLKNLTQHFGILGGILKEGVRDEKREVSAVIAT